jgi:hypothetical protein
VNRSARTEDKPFRQRVLLEGNARNLIHSSYHDQKAASARARSIYCSSVTGALSLIVLALLWRF